MKPTSPTISATLATVAAGAIASAAAPTTGANERKGQTDVVAAVICAEARGEYWAGMCAVAQVIRNRGLDAFATVTRPHQFSCLNHTTPKELIEKMKHEVGWSDAHCLARWLCNQSPKPSAFTHCIGDATHYHSKSVLPTWAVGQRPVAVCGRHLFYKLK